MLINENIIYIGEEEQMSNRRNNNTNHQNKHSRDVANYPVKNTQNEQKSIKEKLSYLFNHNIISSLMATFIGGAIIFYVHDLPEDINNLKTEIEVANTKIENLQGNYSILNSQIWSMKKEALVPDKVIDENITESTTILFAESSLATAIKNSYESDETIFNSKGDLILLNEEQIATEVKNNESITKNDLKNQYFIISYQQNGEDVLFYGKYNDMFQWDGDCIINRYKDSKLTFIMEAKYDSGKLLDYKQVFKGSNTAGIDVWYVSQRKVEDEKRESGHTYSYFFYGDYEASLDINTIQESDILDVNTFCSTIPSTIEGYYNGYTSSGLFNDDTDACMVKYFNDGTVRMLYVGKFKNGLPYDLTGNAWHIVKDRNTNYMYYKGNFRDGYPANSKDSYFENPVHIERIKEILVENNFYSIIDTTNLNLSWYEDNK